jgi:translation initiation factor 2-alpha kinase 4
MAPHKTPKNKKPQQHAFASHNGGLPATSPTRESLPVRPSMVSQSTETYEEAQENEREVLKAVFMDDYEESEATGAWSVSCRHSVLSDSDTLLIR